MRIRNFKSDLPQIYEEVHALMLKLHRSDLASQLKDLNIVYICPCTNFGCASFTVAGSNTPDQFEMPGKTRSTSSGPIDLNAEKGKITIVTDQLGRITGFEILKRPDLRRQVMRI